MLKIETNCSFEKICRVFFEKKEILADEIVFFRQKGRS